MVDIKVDEFDNDVVVISIVGNYIFNETSEGEKIFKQVQEKKPKVIGINCKNLKTLDSSGLGVFIKFSKEAGTGDFELFFIDISNQVSSLFDLSKLQHLFNSMSIDEFESIYL